MFIILIPIITIPYVSRTLGVHYIGDYSYFSAIILFLGSFIMFGKNQQGVKVMAQTPQKDRKQVFFDEWIIQILATVPITIIAIIWFYIVSDMVSLIIYLPLLLAFSFDISWFYIGIGEVKNVVLRNTIIKIISVFLIFYFVKSSDDYMIYILINSLGMFFSNIIFFIPLKKYIRFGHAKLKIRINNEYLSESMRLILSQAVVQVYSNLDKPIVGSLSGSEQLAYYSQAQKIARIILAIVVSLSVVLMPKLVELRSSGENQKMIYLFNKSLKYTTIVSLLFTSLIIVNSVDFVPWFFGPAFKPMIPSMMLSALIIVFISVGGVFGNQYTLSKGEYKKYTIPLVIGAVLDIVLLFVLAPIYNAIGATMALVLAELGVYLSRLYYVKDELNLKLIFKKEYPCYLLFIGITIIGLLIPIEIQSVFFRMVVRSVSLIVLSSLILLYTDKALLNDVKKIWIKIRGRTI